VLPRLLAFALTPEAAWRDASRDTERGAVTRHLGVLALLPAIVAALLAMMPSEPVSTAWLTPLAMDSPFASALHGASPGIAVPVTPISERQSPAVAAGVALLAYGGTWLTVASGAAILNLLLPLFSGQRNARRCMIFASYAATPLLLSSVAMLLPSLVAVIALAAIHACYVAYLGLPVMLGVPRGEAGMCLGICTIAGLLAGQIAGYCAGALVSAVASWL
jgi:hypothetical protein